MNCTGTNETISCPLAEVGLCEPMSCAGMSHMHIGVLVMASLALCDTAICCQKEFGCAPRSRPVGTVETVVVVATHVLLAVCMGAVLIAGVVPKTYQNRRDYEARTELWTGLCSFRWVMGLGLRALWCLRPARRVVPVEVAGIVGRV